LAVNLNTKLADEFMEHAVDISRIEADLRCVILGFMKEVELELTSKLKTSNLTLQSRGRTEALLRQSRRIIQSGSQKASDASIKHLQELSVLESEITRKVINDQVGINLLSVGVSKTLLKELATSVMIQGAPSADWWMGNVELGMPGFSNKEQERFITEMRKGITQGETNQQLVQRLRGTRTRKTELLVFKTKLRRVPVFVGGLMDVTTKNAEAIVRTSVQSVTNAARIATLQANDNVVKGIQWLSTLDTRTTEICRALDGLTWNLDYDPVGHDKPFPGPTAHWNCRSTQIPWIKSFEEITGVKGLRDLDPGTRASMDGKVSADLTYNDWFKKQNATRQKEILGPKKLDLYKEGNLSFRDMVDMRGDPLTIPELQAKYSL